MLPERLAEASDFRQKVSQSLGGGSSGGGGGSCSTVESTRPTSVASSKGKLYAWYNVDPCDDSPPPPTFFWRMSPVLEPALGLLSCCLLSHVNHTAYVIFFFYGHRHSSEMSQMFDFHPITSRVSSPPTMKRSLNEAHLRFLGGAVVAQVCDARDIVIHVVVVVIRG